MTFVKHPNSRAQKLIILKSTKIKKMSINSSPNLSMYCPILKESLLGVQVFKMGKIDQLINRVLK